MTDEIDNILSSMSNSRIALFIAMLSFMTIYGEGVDPPRITVEYLEGDKPEWALRCTCYEWQARLIYEGYTERHYKFKVLHSLFPQRSWHGFLVPRDFIKVTEVTDGTSDS